MAQYRDRELTTLMQKELRSGEAVLWSGQPLPGRAMLMGFGIYIFAVPWTAFSLFWTFMASGGVWSTQSASEINWGVVAGSGAMALFGLPFILIGLAMMSSPFWAYAEARKTLYVITNQRAVIVKAHWGTSFKSYMLETLAAATIEKIVNRNGTGHLYFRYEKYKDSEGDIHGKKIGFESFPNVAEAEKKLLQAIEDFKRHKERETLTSSQ